MCVYRNKCVINWDMMCFSFYTQLSKNRKKYWVSHYVVKSIGYGLKMCT